MRRILICLFVLVAAGARAQVPTFQVPALHAAAPPPPASTPPAANPAVSPAEAQSILDVLNDPQKRAQFAATLQNMVKAQKAAAPPPPAVPLAPNSIGAQVIAKSATWFSELSGQVTAFNRVLGNLPAVWAFTIRTMTDPAGRADVLDAAWHLALVVAIAALMQFGFKRALRRPIAALARMAPNGTAEPPAPLQDGATAVRRHYGFVHTLRALRRVPFMLARLLLDLVPIATFLMLAWLGLNFLRPDSQNILWVAITAYSGACVVTVVARALMSPDHPTLRVLLLPGDGPAYAVRWVARLSAVAAFGYAASTIGTVFGMPSPAHEAFIKAVALVDHVILVVIVLQCRPAVARAIKSYGTDASWRRRAVMRLASVWHLAAIFFIIGLWLVWAAQVRHGYEKMWRLFLITAAIGIVMRLIAVVLLGALDRMFRFKPETTHRFPGLGERAGIYYPVLRQAVTVILWLVAALALLQAWGLHSLDWFHGQALGGQLVSALATVMVALLVCVAVWEATNAGLERNLASHTKHMQVARAARLRTLMPILRTMLFVVLATVFGLTTLSEIGVNVAPLLAGAGIIGVAIGFGSQKLVQDFITGIFLLLENAMQVGDWVTVAGLSGSVENLSIRTMRLRAGDGSVHIIPFSSVSTVTNVNRGIGNAAVSVNIPMEEDSDHVSDVLTEIAREMRQEPRFADMMRSDFQLWGVDKVDSGVVTVVGQIVCTDSGRWAVQREFNRRMTIRFKDAGIHIATPTTTVYYRDLPPLVPKAPQDESAAPAAQVRESPPPAALGNSS
jgi:moderate conductance mechanosensitive channel